MNKLKHHSSEHTHYFEDAQTLAFYQRLLTGQWAYEEWNRRAIAQ